MTPEMLKRENRFFQQTGGVSRNNRQQGFRSAFRDTATGRVYLSRFANDTPAPLHLLDGLPDELVTVRDAGGRTVAVKQTVIAGFLRAGRFYTRQQTADLLKAKG
jgi:hypothetical protein